MRRFSVQRGHSLEAAFCYVFPDLSSVFVYPRRTGYTLQKAGNHSVSLPVRSVNTRYAVLSHFGVGSTSATPHGSFSGVSEIFRALSVKMLLIRPWAVAMVGVSTSYQVCQHAPIHASSPWIGVDRTFLIFFLQIDCPTCFSQLTRYPLAAESL